MNNQENSEVNAALAEAEVLALRQQQEQEQEQEQANSTYQETQDAPGPSEEGFSNLRWNGIQLDLVLKAIFFGCLFYLLSQPELYKITKKCCKKVDGVLLHAIVFAVLYFIVIHFI